ncbi:LAQU0S12e03202g1_1 [Lachancea quebecensis]|uniref:LAQU0S12e03202g1_1 n=1 Tax=Lachancea quebecensis TaxID=1654605 RepID=A0A0P1KX64_9SACH|nr:LAQU0S12e03202g1_1 [Lachancea quebecensis]
MFRNLVRRQKSMIARDFEKLEISVPTAADDEKHASGTSGRPNQSVTKPVSLDASTGEVLVRKSTGKTKVRKGQTTDEFERQRSHFFEVERGPVWTPVGWMTSQDPLLKLDTDPSSDLEIKQVRQKLASHCHLLYYRKQYADCAGLCESLLLRFEALGNRKKIQREIDELHHMLERCRVSA